MIDRSAAGLTVVSALAELLAVLGSGVSEDALAWFVSWPGDCGLTFTSTVAFWPSVTVPSAHVTTPSDSRQVPCEGVAESKVTFAGRVSLTWTPLASDGPEFWTVSV